MQISEYWFCYRKLLDINVVMTHSVCSNIAVTEQLWMHISKMTEITLWECERGGQQSFIFYVTEALKRSQVDRTTPNFACTIRAGWCISEVCADQVRLKHLYIESTVQKDFSQKSLLWKVFALEKRPKNWENPFIFSMSWNLKKL